MKSLAEVRPSLIGSVRRQRPPRGAVLWWLTDKALRRKGAGIAFAQEGEDRLLEILLSGRSPGVYVDVGAFDPVRFSNTMSLYLRGWRGLNIEPRPGAEAAFRRIRQRDSFLGIGIGTSEGAADYVEFNEPALNTFNAGVVHRVVEASEYRALQHTSIPIRRLEDVLDKHLPEGRFDLLTIDAEGSDLDVLQSNNWVDYRPYLVCCEAHEADDAARAIEYLASVEYSLVARTVRTLFFRRAD